MTKRASRGTLNPSVIVEAAIALVTRHSLEALTMRRLADELHVGTTSLYTHFRDKRALLTAIADEIYERFEMPASTASPTENLRRLLTAYFHLLANHPVLLHMEAGAREVDFATASTAEVRVTEEMYQCLHDLGLDRADAVASLAVLLRFVYGSAFIYPLRRTWDDDERHWEKLSKQWGGLPPDGYPAMHYLASAFPHFSQQEIFERGLDLLLRAVVATPDKRAEHARSTNEKVSRE